MIILAMSEQELHAHWDRIEAAHPWGPMPIGEREPSKYLMKAYEEKLLTFDQALELYMGSTGIGTTDP